MGIVKQMEIEKEDNWKSLCDRNGWTCQICGDYPERVTPAGYEGGLCPSCHNAGN